MTFPHGRVHVRLKKCAPRDMPTLLLDEFNDAIKQRSVILHDPLVKHRLIVIKDKLRMLIAEICSDAKR